MIRNLTDIERDNLIRDFYNESNSDLVGLWEIIKEVGEIMGNNDEAKEQSLSIMRELLSKGLRAGDPPYCPTGYQPWTNQSPDAVVNRIRVEWSELGHTPSIPDIVWFGRPEKEQ